MTTPYHEPVTGTHDHPHQHADGVHSHPHAHEADNSHDTTIHHIFGEEQPGKPSGPGEQVPGGLTARAFRGPAAQYLKNYHGER